MNGWQPQLPPPNVSHIASVYQLLSHRQTTITFLINGMNTEVTLHLSIIHIIFNANHFIQILHHWAKEFFAPTALIAHRDETLNHINVYIVRDTLRAPEPMLVTLEIFNWDSLNVQFAKSQNVTVVKENLDKIFQGSELSKNISTFSNQTAFNWWILSIWDCYDRIVSCNLACGTISMRPFHEAIFFQKILRRPLESLGILKFRYVKCKSSAIFLSYTILS